MSLEGPVAGRRAGLKAAGYTGQGGEVSGPVGLAGRQLSGELGRVSAAQAYSSSP